MLTEERHQHIIHLVDQKDIVTITELIQNLNASESTIRRDLQTLEKQGLLARVHGGAKKNHLLNFEATMQDKTRQYHQEKISVAKYAATLIKENDVIYLDAGSTTLEMIPFIPNNLGIKVMTNSVKHAAALIERQIPTIIVGGTIKLSTFATLGATALKELEMFHFNRVFMGMNGAHLTAGFTTPDPEEAALKKAALKNSEAAFVLLDTSKFQKITFTQVAKLSAAEIITNNCPHKLKDDFEKQTPITEVNQ